MTCRFDLPADVTGGTLTLEIGNEYLVPVSSAGQNWRTVLKESAKEHDLGNLDHRRRSTQLRPRRRRVLYARVGDSYPDDGGGGWLDHLALQLSR